MGDAASTIERNHRLRRYLQQQFQDYNKWTQIQTEETAGDDAVRSSLK